MDILDIIKDRRSIRAYRSDPVTDEDIHNILEAARWSPSGLNNQPWRFLILKDEVKDDLAQFTTSNDIILQAPVALVVCMDKKASYNYEKDLMALGACIQNMLLAAKSLDLGTCWLGEILNRKAEVHSTLGLTENLELWAVICLGYPAQKAEPGERKILKNLMIR